MKSFQAEMIAQSNLQKLSISLLTNCFLQKQQERGEELGSLMEKKWRMKNLRKKMNVNNLIQLAVLSRKHSNLNFDPRPSQRK